jgi:hypothetical protein
VKQFNSLFKKNRRARRQSVKRRRTTPTARMDTAMVEQLEPRLLLDAQTITSSVHDSTLAGNTQFNLDVIYDVRQGTPPQSPAPDPNQSTGILLLLFYDTSQITFDNDPGNDPGEDNAALPAGSLNEFPFDVSARAIETDSSNADGDDDTDRRIRIFYNSLGGTFPAGPVPGFPFGEVPLDLLNIPFTTAAGFSGTQINLGFEGSLTFNEPVEGPQGAGQDPFFTLNGPPELSVGDVSLAEGTDTTTAFDVSVSLSSQPLPGETVTVEVVTFENNGAESGSDFTDIGTITLSFPEAGPLVQTVTVNVNADNIFEDDETFGVRIQNNTATSAIADAEATITITNDDALPTIDIADASADEGTATNNTLSFALSLSNPSEQAITVTADTGLVSQIGTGGDDFTPKNEQITFQPGQTERFFDVQTIADTVNEGDETFVVDISSATNVTLGDNEATGTIVNDDPVPTVSVGDVSLPEGDAGTTDFMFTASLTNPIDQEATVRFMTVNQSAEDETGDGDFTAVDQTVTFAALQTQVTVVVAVNGDETFEGTATTSGDETFAVTLSEHNNLLPNGDATGTITDDDAAIQITGAAVPGAIPEGLPGTIVTSINSVLGTQHTGVGLNLHFDSSQITPALVDAFTTVFDGGFLTGGPQVLSDDTNLDNDASTDMLVLTAWAAPGEDFPANTDLFAFNFLTDNLFTGTTVNYSFVDLPIGFEGVSDPVAVDLLPLPSFSIGDASFTEGTNGTHNVSFEITLSEAVPEQTSVQISSTDGTAVSVANGLPADFTAFDQIVSFAPNSTSELITIAINADNIDEANPDPESFTVTLGVVSDPELVIVNPSNNVASIDIMDDDDTPTVSIADVLENEGIQGDVSAPEGLNEFEFIVSLSNPSDEVVTVDFTTRDGPAVTGAQDASEAGEDDDYAATAGQLMFNPGTTQASVIVNVTTDADTEDPANPDGDENFFVDLSAPVNAVLGLATGEGTIVDDDRFVILMGNPLTYIDATGTLVTVQITDLGDGSFDGNIKVFLPPDYDVNDPESTPRNALRVQFLDTDLTDRGEFLTARGNIGQDTRTEIEDLLLVGEQGNGNTHIGELIGLRVDLEGDAEITGSFSSVRFRNFDSQHTFDIGPGPDASHRANIEFVRFRDVSVNSESALGTVNIFNVTDRDGVPDVWTIPSVDELNIDRRFESDIVADLGAGSTDAALTIGEMTVGKKLVRSTLNLIGDTGDISVFGTTQDTKIRVLTRALEGDTAPDHIIDGGDYGQGNIRNAGQFVLGNVVRTDIFIDNFIDKIQAKRYNDGTIEVNRIRRLKTTSRDTGPSGEQAGFNARLLVRGVGVRQDVPVVRKASVRGALTSDLWRILGGDGVSNFTADSVADNFVLNMTGRLNRQRTAGAFDGSAFAAGGFGTVNVGSAAGATFLTAFVGDDNALGGINENQDQYEPGSFDSLRIRGNAIDVLAGAGLVPVDEIVPIFNNGNDIVRGLDSAISSLDIEGIVSGTTFFGAVIYGPTTINDQTVDPTDPFGPFANRFFFGEVVDDIG